MLSYGAIAEAGITEERIVVSTGAEIFLPVASIALATIVPTIGVGSLIDFPGKAISLVPVVPTIGSGSTIAFPVKVISLTPIVLDVSNSGVLIDFGTAQSAFTDFTIAGGALTEALPSYTYQSEVKLFLRTFAIDGLASASIDFPVANIALLPKPTETVARIRAVQAIAIDS